MTYHYKSAAFWTFSVRFIKLITWKHWKIELIELPFMKRKVRKFFTAIERFESHCKALWKWLHWFSIILWAFIALAYVENFSIKSNVVFLSKLNFRAYSFRGKWNLTKTLYSRNEPKALADGCVFVCLRARIFANKTTCEQLCWLLYKSNMLSPILLSLPEISDCARRTQACSMSSFFFLSPVCLCICL